MSTNNHNRRKPQKPHGPRANGQIHYKEVRLIDQDGNQLGVVSIQEAMSKAEQADLDLIEVAADAKPPVCKIGNLSKIMYQKERAEKASKKHRQRDPHQLRLRPNIADHDLQTKIRATEKFLAKGDQVYFVVMMRGRMQNTPELGKRVLERIKEGLGDNFQIIKPVSQSGNQITMTLGPKK